MAVRRRIRSTGQPAALRIEARLGVSHLDDGVVGALSLQSWNGLALRPTVKERVRGLGNVDFSLTHLDGP